MITSLWLFLSLNIGHAASVHTLENALRAVEHRQVDAQILVYKVRDFNHEKSQQSWRPYLSRQSFTTHPLFRRASVHSVNFGHYQVRRYAAALSITEAQEELREIFADPNVEYAYFEPRMTEAVEIQRMQKPPVKIAQLADFESSQFYLNAAPEGVDARYAWALPGGTGQGIRVLDVETGWHTDHLEFGSVFFDNGKNARRDHGTAVWGEIAARPDGLGVTGIAYDVQWGIAGTNFDGLWQQYPKTTASVIEEAVEQLRAGDVLVIEQHAPLVDAYGPIEYFEPIFQILRVATERGIHCVAAAGNGYSDLNDPKYAGVFDLAVRDSGCILVGAVDSPRGSRARQRSEFSNYGSRVDACGYGEDVTTTGYGDLYSGVYQNRLANYTNQFSGTSSATPIVAGAVASLLGIAAQKGIVISPPEMRQALRQTGTRQEAEQGDRVGNMPDLRALINYFGLN